MSKINNEQLLEIIFTIQETYLKELCQCCANSICYTELEEVKLNIRQNKIEVIEKENSHNFYLKLFLEKILKKLETKTFCCVNSEFGCNVKGLLKEIKTHENDCFYKPVYCSECNMIFFHGNNKCGNCDNKDNNSM